MSDFKEEFEKRFSNHAWFKNERLEPHSYADGVTNLAYGVWQAAQSAMQAELDGQEAVGEKSLNGIEWQFANTVYNMPVGTKLFTRPPITSERELGLLARIKALLDFITNNGTILTISGIVGDEIKKLKGE